MLIVSVRELRKRLNIAQHQCGPDARDDQRDDERDEDPEHHLPELSVNRHPFIIVAARGRERQPRLGCCYAYQQ